MYGSERLIKHAAGGWPGPGRSALLTLLALGIAAAPTAAQTCPERTVATDLRRPMALVEAPSGNLLVSETGTFAPGSGRISILNRAGGRRTLLDGLPAGVSDVNEPAGPAGLALVGRTLYVLVSIGDAVLPSGVGTLHLPNPNVSSPIFSSLLAIHVSPAVEKLTNGFTLTPAHEAALADGERVTLSNGGLDWITIDLVTNFPNYVAAPLPDRPDIVRGSNPYAVAVHDGLAYVTDGGRNLLWRVDLSSGEHAALSEFPAIPNPLPVGGPFTEAVPTGVEFAAGRLLVTLFRGVPFAPGTSSVVEIDPATGAWSHVISGLKTAIDVMTLAGPGGLVHLVLQHSSGMGPFFPGPGLMLRVDTPGGTPVTVANCLARPTDFLLVRKGRTFYVTELLTGRVVALH